MERTSAPPILLGDSVVMQRVRDEICLLGSVDASVLIEGEPGTGKTLVARALHATSRRSRGPFVVASADCLEQLWLAESHSAENTDACATLGPTRQDPFATARGGTLLLDEVGNLSRRAQSVLLRALDDRERRGIDRATRPPFDVRLLATTHGDLQRDIAEGRFRRDLFYRLHVGRIRLPPLRDRPEDIPLLALLFARRTAATHRKTLDGISPDALACLKTQPWPGNVRELASTMESAVARAERRTLRVADLLPHVMHTNVMWPSTSPLVCERDQLLQALKRAGNNRSLAARALGISRSALYRRLAALTREDIDSEL